MALGDHSGSSTEVLYWCPTTPRLFQAVESESCHSPAGSVWAHSHLHVLVTTSSQEGGKKNIPKPCSLLRVHLIKGPITPEVAERDMPLLSWDTWLGSPWVDGVPGCGPQVARLRVVLAPGGDGALGLGDGALSLGTCGTGAD